MSVCKLEDGRELFFRERGEGPVLVLLHGWSMSSAVFGEVMPQLAESYRVLAVDLPGHGASELREIDYSIDSLAADIEDFLRQLGISRCALLGWSMGGQVALRMILRRQDGIEKLILVATTPCFVASPGWPHGMDPTQVRAMDRQMQRDYKGSMGEFFRLMFEDENLDPQRYREIVRFAVREGALPEREVARQGLKLLARTDLRPDLGRIDRPTLVHYGGEDQITVPGACHELAAALPRSEETDWPGIGHAPFLSRPGESVRLWREFLQ